MNITDNIQYAIDIAKNNSRKFDPEDIKRDEKLRVAAMEYIKSYDGDFGFMLSLQRKEENGWSMSPAMLKGALNCMLAESQRKGEFREKKDNVSLVYGSGEVDVVIPDGCYTVVWDDEGKEYTTLRLKNDKYGPRKGRKAGVQIISAKYGMDWTKIGYVAGDKFQPWKSFVDNGRIAGAVILLLESDDYTTYGMAYALQSGHCYRCNKQLEVPASVYRGLGPVCAKIVANRGI
jgi:Family of unknown function (DUF6011)